MGERRAIRTGPVSRRPARVRSAQHRETVLPWSIDSETGVLTDVLLCRPDPELDLFAAGGGSVHCMTMPLAREPA